MANLLEKEIYGGNVYELSSDKFDEFFLEKEIDLSTDFKTKYLRQLGIPKNFYDTLGEKLKKDIVVSAKTKFIGRDEKMLILERGKELVFPKIVKNNYEFIENYKALNTKENFLFINEEFNNGIQKYFYSSEAVNMQEFTPGAFVYLPIFNYGKIQVDMGMLRLICTNGVSERLDMTPLQFNANDNFISENIINILNGITNSIDDIVQTRKDLIVDIKSRNINLFEAKDYLKENREKIDCNYVVNESLKHIELLEKDVEVPNNSPLKIETHYDLFNLMTFYSHYDKSNFSQVSKADAKILRYFKNEFNNNTGRNISVRVNLNQNYNNLIKVKNDKA